MTRRVVQGPLPGGGQGMRVSRPGFDVLATLNRKQLAFDTRQSGSATIFLSGTISVGPGGSGTSPAYQSLAFGRTFAEIPPVFVFRKINENTWINYAIAAGDEFASGYTTWFDTEFDVRPEPVRVFTSSIQFRRAISGTLTLRYLILKPVS